MTADPSATATTLFDVMFPKMHLACIFTDAQSLHASDAAVLDPFERERVASFARAFHRRYAIAIGPASVQPALLSALNAAVPEIMCLPAESAVQAVALLHRLLSAAADSAAQAASFAALVKAQCGDIRAASAGALRIAAGSHAAATTQNSAFAELADFSLCSIAGASSAELVAAVPSLPPATADAVLAFLASHALEHALDE